MYDYGFFSFESKADFLRRSEEFWNPDKTRFWQDAGVDLVIDRREGYLLLGHGGPPADRPAPQRRHLQPRPPQPRADRDARAGDGPLRHRQPPLPGARAHRARRGARRDLPAEHAARDLRRRGGGEATDIAIKTARHTRQRRKIVSIRKGYHGHTGLAVAAGDDRFSTLFLSDRPGRVRAGAVQRPRRDGGGAARRRRRRRGDRDDPRHLRLPAARARLPARRSSGCASATARSTSPTRCRPG